MNAFYVYVYLDQDDVPFYVGKGKDYRYLVNSHLRKGDPNKFLQNKIRKVGVKNVKVHFLHKDIGEGKAICWEKYWIKYIGRRDLKEGTLCNLTDGGEGTTGHIQSKETRLKKSKTLKGHSVSKGARRKMSEAKKGKKLTEAHRLNAIEGRKGYRHSEETKQKMRKSHKGRVR